VYGDWFSPITLLALYGIKLQVYISDRTIPNYKFSFPIPQLKKWLYPKSSGFIAQTQRAKDFKIKQFGDKLRIELIPNALPEFYISCSKTGSRENKLIYVGRFEWEKDPEILIYAMKHLVSIYPNWTLEMAGSGPLLEPMKVLVQELSLRENVFFLGKVSKVEDLYQSASILVLPSVVEGFPNTMIEGMSFGLPTVCFSDLPCEGIITHRKDGLVVKERTPEALAKAIGLLIENEIFRDELGANATQSVKRFDKSVISTQIIDFMKIS
jgi:glycosyltransferase involved in cell wall biosynthesis